MAVCRFARFLRARGQIPGYIYRYVCLFNSNHAPAFIDHNNKNWDTQPHYMCLHPGERISCNNHGQLTNGECNCDATYFGGRCQFQRIRESLLSLRARPFVCHCCQIIQYYSKKHFIKFPSPHFPDGQARFVGQHACLHGSRRANGYQNNAPCECHSGWSGVFCTVPICGLHGTLGCPNGVRNCAQVACVCDTG